MLMNFRHFDTILSEEFEFVLLENVLNDYINKKQAEGCHVKDVQELKDKILRNSCVVQKDIEVPF